MLILSFENRRLIGSITYYYFKQHNKKHYIKNKLRNLFLKGPSGATSRFINSITELYATPNKPVLKGVDHSDFFGFKIMTFYHLNVFY